MKVCGIHAGDWPPELKNNKKKMSQIVSNKINFPKKIPQNKKRQKQNFGERRRVAPGQLTPPTTIYIYTPYILYYNTQVCVCVRATTF